MIFTLGTIESVKRIGVIFLLLAAVAPSTSGYERGAADTYGENDVDLRLSIVGYNYTDREIDHYSVDGASGGSIRLSSPTSGGSGIACCMILPRQVAGMSKVRVRWQVDGCKYVAKNASTGRTATVRHLFYKEVEVPVERDRGKDLAYVETHFYPDGSVRVRLTEEASLPRFLLSDRRAEKSAFPRCKNDKRPD